MDYSLIPWKDVFTISAAAVGAVLGIMNTWNSMSLRRVRLRVSPAHAIAPHFDGDMFVIEVTNLSAFPVTISEVGFSRRADKGRRAAVAMPMVTDGKAWPRRLEAREAVTLLVPVDNLYGERAAFGRAYAHTACGEFRYGTSPALKQLSDAVRKGEPLFHRSAL
jgi:hypothetical protein